MRIRLTIKSIGSGLLAAPLAAGLAFVGCIIVAGGVIIPVAGLLGVGDPAVHHLPDPVVQALYAMGVVITLGAGLAAGI